VSERFYHVDRRGDLEPGTVIEREDVTGQTPEEHALLAALFTDGVAPHGRQYCTTDLYEGDADDLWDVSCELLFELVRRDRFAWRPSRFESVFGFERRSEARRFVETFGDESAMLFEVSAADGFAADLHLVDARTIPQGVRQAHYYWEGTTDRDDPLWEVLLEPPVTVERRVETVDLG
jgi:hypothetical protein